MTDVARITAFVTARQADKFATECIDFAIDGSPDAHPLLLADLVTLLAKNAEDCPSHGTCESCGKAICEECGLNYRPPSAYAAGCTASIHCLDHDCWYACGPCRDEALRDEVGDRAYDESRGR